MATPMNLDRIRPSIDVEAMQECHVTVVGGAFGLIADLARCGLGAATLIDFDRADESNPQRQDFTAEEGRAGVFKTHACAARLRGINPVINVATLERDFCSLSEAEINAHLGHTDLLVLSADSFMAQARGNIVALRLGIPALWIGLYTGGRAGEIVFAAPGATRACYRCVCSSRYAAHTARTVAGVGVEPRPDRTPSAGGTILDLRLVDAIAGQVAVGLLTRGADNRFGRLIERLGNRNLLQIKIDPDYTLNGQDVFGRYLGNHPANFSFTTLALPMEPEPNCADCAGSRE
jgi:molybdopterin/thiamine biosynthesis adenylyltransferase